MMSSPELIEDLTERLASGKIDFAEVRRLLHQKGKSSDEISSIIRQMDAEVMAFHVASANAKRGNGYVVAGTIMAVAGFIMTIYFIGPLVYFFGYGPFTAGMGLILAGRKMRSQNLFVKTKRGRIFNHRRNH